MHYDVLQLKFYTEFQWLIDYSVFVMFVYLVTEVLLLFRLLLSFYYFEHYIFA